MSDIEHLEDVERLQTEIERLRDTDRLREAAFQAYADQERNDRVEIERQQRLIKFLEETEIKLRAENERLRTALQNLVSDILEYERIVNLSPNPGKQDCWQSVTEARRILAGEERGAAAAAAVAAAVAAERERCAKFIEASNAPGALEWWTAKIAAAIRKGE